jgi:hypothetical protein
MSNWKKKFMRDITYVLLTENKEIVNFWLISKKIADLI